MGLANSFSLQLKGFADKVKDRADDIVGAVVINIAAELDSRSPVGDATAWEHPAPKGYTGGRFRANWQLGIGVQPEGEKNAIDKTGEATQAAIIDAVPRDAAGKLYYLANNVPYAERIEDGWSKQAPRGVVSLTVTRFKPIVDQALAEGKI